MKERYKLSGITGDLQYLNYVMATFWESEE
jgi:hypothetical protein